MNFDLDGFNVCQQKGTNMRMGTLKGPTGGLSRKFNVWLKSLLNLCTHFLHKYWFHESLCILFIPKFSIYTQIYFQDAFRGVTSGELVYPYCLPRARKIVFSYS